MTTKYPHHHYHHDYCGPWIDLEVVGSKFLNIEESILESQITSNQPEYPLKILSY